MKPARNAKESGFAFTAGFCAGGGRDRHHFVYGDAVWPSNPGAREQMSIDRGCSTRAPSSFLSQICSVPAKSGRPRNQAQYSFPAASLQVSAHREGLSTAPRRPGRKYNGFGDPEPQSASVRTNSRKYTAGGALPGSGSQPFGHSRAVQCQRPLGPSPPPPSPRVRLSTRTASRLAWISTWPSADRATALHRWEPSSR